MSASIVVDEALRRGVSEQHIFDITKIDQWYLHKFHNIVNEEERIKRAGVACFGLRVFAQS